MPTQGMKRVLSGIQPTGSIHLGNYFGAVENWIKLQDNYICFFSVVDLHAMTTVYNPKDLQNGSINMFIELLSCGIDPQKANLFIQSHVPAHTELSWILSCVCSYGELSRMTQFKDKSSQIQSNKDSVVSAGLFSYPILQAADILLYLADFVPVGKDQEQHLELSRNICNRFNQLFGDLFPEPQPLFTDSPKILSLADPLKKMSKSLGDKHVIGLFEPEDSIVKKVRTAVTDSGMADTISPGVENLLTILKGCGRQDAADHYLSQYKNGTIRYKELKDDVAASITELTQPFRLRKKEWEENTDTVERLIVEMADKTNAAAEQTMKEVRKMTGIAQARKMV